MLLSAGSPEAARGTMQSGYLLAVLKEHCTMMDPVTRAELKVEDHTFFDRFVMLAPVIAERWLEKLQNMFDFASLGGLPGQKSKKTSFDR